MLVSAFEMHVAAETFPQINTTRHPILSEKDPPAQHKLCVRLPENFIDSSPNHLSPDSSIKAVLLVKKKPSNAAPVANMFFDTGQSLNIPPHSLEFSKFQYRFLANQQYDVRIEFYLVHPLPNRDAPSSPSTPPNQAVGYIHTDLASVLFAENERLEISILSSASEIALGKNAELSVEWCRPTNDKFILEMRCKVQLSGGWPFSASRPFFVLYRWEPNCNWTPVYRSEVLTEKSTSPDGKGCMVFRLAILDVRQVIGEDENRPLRLELFHFKVSEDPKLLAFFSTSLVLLRQAKQGARQKLVLNIFPKGELVGHLKLHASMVTASRYFFSLQANFGGPIVGNFVYMTISVSEPSRRSSWFALRDQRPFFTISHYSDQGKWEEVYRSESASRVSNNRCYYYRIMKLTERKLNANHSGRSLSINFHRQLDRGNSCQLAYFVTKVSTLLEAPRGMIFQLIPYRATTSNDSNESKSGTSSGYARLEQAERLDSRIFFSISVVLGMDPPAGANLKSFDDDTPRR